MVCNPIGKTWIIENHMQYIKYKICILEGARRRVACYATPTVKKIRGEIVGRII